MTAPADIEALQALLALGLSARPSDPPFAHFARVRSQEPSYTAPPKAKGKSQLRKRRRARRARRAGKK